MKNHQANSIIAQSFAKFKAIIERSGLLEAKISVLAKPLTPEEAIGTPGRRDFPIIEGRERVVEAQVLGARGHAYTDSPAEFIGTIKNVLDFSLTTNKTRAIYIAAMNATLRHLGMAESTVHCKDEEPEKCAEVIASHIWDKWGKVKIGFIGLNPAIAEILVKTFGTDNICITDLNGKNIDTVRFGVKIQNGKTMTDKLLEQSDVTLITGTTLVNGTFDYIWQKIQGSGKDYLIYGVTAAGICSLMKINRICPYGRNE